MRDHLRILMVADVSPARILGGAERTLWEHAWRLAAAGCQVQVLSRATPDSPETQDRLGVQLRHFPVDRRSLLALFRTSILGARRAAAEQLARTGADVLHCYQPLSGYGVLASAAGRRLPSLYTFLSPAPLEYRSRRGGSLHHRRGLLGALGAGVLWTIERSCLRRASRIHVLSDYSAGQLRTLYRIGSDRIVKIPGGADLARFQPAPDRAAVRRSLGLPMGVPLLLTVRNLEPRMGLETLIEAIALLRRHRSDVTLLIGGAGSRQRELEALVSSHVLQGQVRFLGYVAEADLPRLYQAADLFVLPTRELEGFGLITVEALACGTPVLGTAVGATPEILRPLDSSLLFPDPSAQAMADGIRRFLVRICDDPAGSERLRHACRLHVEHRFDWQQSVAHLKGVLDALCDDAPCPPARDGTALEAPR